MMTQCRRSYAAYLCFTALRTSVTSTCRQHACVCRAVSTNWRIIEW